MLKPGPRDNPKGERFAQPSHQQRFEVEMTSCFTNIDQNVSHSRLNGFVLHVGLSQISCESVLRWCLAFGFGDKLGYDAILLPFPLV